MKRADTLRSARNAGRQMPEEPGEQAAKQGSSLVVGLFMHSLLLLEIFQKVTLSQAFSRGRAKGVPG